MAEIKPHQDVGKTSGIKAFINYLVVILSVTAFIITLINQSKAIKSMLDDSSVTSFESYNGVNINVAIEPINMLIYIIAYFVFAALIFVFGVKILNAGDGMIGFIVAIGAVILLAIGGAQSFKVDYVQIAKKSVAQEFELKEVQSTDKNRIWFYSDENEGTVPFVMNTVPGKDGNTDYLFVASTP